jgi:alkanesulfonate monooxygenase SsuD/methylene tetrahydromethanopterin reductase-like flavin-dependent oxidoreductase (luciferase family)
MSLGRTEPAAPRVWLAGANPAVLAGAGRRYDGFIPYSTRLDYAAGLVALWSAASYAGRDADDVTPAMYLRVLVDDDAERGHRAAEEWCLRWYELPFEMVASVQAFVIGSAAGVAARIARYVEAGARTSATRARSSSGSNDAIRTTMWRARRDHSGPHCRPAGR